MKKNLISLSILPYINGVEDVKVYLAKNIIHSTSHGEKSSNYTFIISEDIMDHFKMLFSNINLEGKDSLGNTCYRDNIRDFKVRYNLTRTDNDMSINSTLYDEFNQYFYNTLRVFMGHEQRYGYFAIIKLIIAEILEIKITQFSLSIETIPTPEKKRWFKRLFEAEGSDMESPSLDVSPLGYLNNKDSYIDMDIIKDALSDILDDHPYDIKCERIGRPNYWGMISTNSPFAYFIMFDEFFETNEYFYSLISRVLQYYYEETGREIAFIQYGGALFNTVKRIYFLRNDLKQLDLLDTKNLENALVIKRNKK